MDKKTVDTGEVKYRFGYRLGRRLLALILVAAMLGSMVLMWQVQIRDYGMQFVGTVLEEAQQVTRTNTPYLSQPTLERAWRVLKATVSKPDTYEEFDTYASLAIAKGDYADAVGYMQGCIDTYSGADDAELAMLWLRKGSLLTLTEQPEAAAECYDKALELCPDLADACLLRAQMMSELGRQEEAAADLIRYQELAGSNPVIQAALGGLYESIENYDAAIECYTLAIESGSYEPTTLASRGRCRILSGDSAGAKDDLERFFREEGEDPTGDVMAMLGMCRMEAGEYEKAIKAFHSAIHRDYRNSGLLYQQCAAAAFAVEDYETVIADGKEALALAEQDGTDPREMLQLYQWLGYAYFAQSQFEEAAGMFDRVLELEPDAEFIHYYSGISRMTLGHLEEAIRHFEASAARGEHASVCLYNAALCEIELERYEAAEAALETAIEKNDSPEAVQEAAALLETLREYTDTMEESE